MITPGQKIRLERIQSLANIMDSQFEILGFKVGLDAIIGLLPGAGDAITTIVSWYIVWEAYLVGVPFSKLLRMIFNVIGDFLVGTIPIAGDLLDVAVKVNKANVKIVEKHLFDLEIAVKD